VGIKRSVGADKARLKHHILPHVKDVPLPRFTLDHADEVMRKLPAERSAATRRQVAQLVHRVLKLAVYPCRIIKASPIPPGWLPKPGKLKARTYLRPEEDRQLMACKEVELADRLLFGFLAREGMRTGEAVRLRWADLTLDPTDDKGSVRLDVNKTDDPRSWALSPGVAAALRQYRKLKAPRPSPPLWCSWTPRGASAHRTSLCARSGARCIPPTSTAPSCSNRARPGRRSGRTTSERRSSPSRWRTARPRRGWRTEPATRTAA
jgi:integrase